MWHVLEKFVVTKDKDIFELKIRLLYEDMFPQLKGYLQQTWSKNISKEDHGQIFFIHIRLHLQDHGNADFSPTSLTYFWNTNFQK